MYITAEYLFIENLIINFIILQSTKVITRTKVSKKRILIFSCITALYPFVIFSKYAEIFTSFYIKLVISFAIVKLTYNSSSLILYIKQLSAFYIMSFVLAGASIGAYYFTNSHKDLFFKDNYLIMKFPLKYLVIGVVMGVVLLVHVFYYYQEKIRRERELFHVTVYYMSKEISMMALLDTGNSLVDPLSNTPVFVVEYKILSNILPPLMKEVFEKNEEIDFNAVQNLMEVLEEVVIHIIPYKSIGTENGILLGFKPDYIKVSNGTSITIYEDLIIGIFNGKLSFDDQYNGLLNLSILKREELCQ